MFCCSSMYFVLDHLSTLSAQRYVIAAATACYVWDHALTLGDELRYIWRRQWSVSSASFIAIRYISCACFLCAAYLTSGLRPSVNYTVSIIPFLHLRYSFRTRRRCTTIILAVSILGSLSVSVSNVFHASRMLELWKVKRARAFMWTSFIVTFVANGLSIALASYEIYRHSSYARGFGVDVCYLTQFPLATVGIYACMLLFDSIATGFILSNALHQPYRQGIQIVWRLRRDGMISYAVMMVQSVVVIVDICVASDPNSVVSVIILMWCLKAIIVMRFILRVETVKHALAEHFTTGGEAYELHFTPSLQLEAPHQENLHRRVA